jgi:hypothetical protein
LASWRRIRERIHDEFERARSAERRTALLALNHSIMNLADKAMNPNDLEKFREIRGHSYSLLIVKECLIDAKVCAKTAAIVTRREVAAGRMAPNHDLRKMDQMVKFAAQVTQTQLLTQKYAPKPPGMVGRALSWLLG